jgi:predicted Rossmann fold flavoprotein
VTLAATDVDVAIVGGGAAGLATAIFAAQQQPALRVAVLDGARRPGAKILVSGGSRCNVTNATVSEADFNGGRPAIIRRVLRALPVRDTVAFFAAIGVPLHEEPLGKLFPDSNRSRDVLDCLLGALAAHGATLRSEHRVHQVAPRDRHFEIVTARGTLTAGAVVLATGGLALPKSGSDGLGYELARRLGHTLVPTTPALAPLVLDDGAFHAALSGVAQPVRLELKAAGSIRARVDGAMLWTHFGVSGPAALDISRHWHRARLDGQEVSVTASLLPGTAFDAAEEWWLTYARRQPRASVHKALGSLLPASVASAVTRHLAIGPETLLADLTRADRRCLVHATLNCPLPVRDSRGYTYAEATAGGVDLSEIDPATMESRPCPGLYLVGEILDVDGRLGGFNFQWAWSSAKVAGVALAKRRAVM